MNEWHRLSWDNMQLLCTFRLIFHDYLVKGLPSVLAQPAIKHSMDNGDCLGYRGIPKVPPFVYKPIGDELAPTKTHIN
jgi:hypothetical protein